MRLLMVVVLCSAAAVAQEAGPSRNSLTNREVETLVDAGFSADFITEVIGSSRPEFDTTAGAIAELKKHGVKEDVIRAMLAGRPAAAHAPAEPAAFGGRGQAIRVFLQVSPDPRAPGSLSQTAEIVHTFAVNCPSLMVTSRRDTAAFLVVLDRTSRKLLRPGTSRMVVFDRGGDTVYGSAGALPKAVRAFCGLAQNLTVTKAEQSLPGTLLPMR
jgi:hypothetical protein